MSGEEKASIIGWTLQTFATPFVDWLKDEGQKAKWKHFDWPKAEQAYLDKVRKLYDRVRILGNSVDVPLGNIFTQVYILDKPTARQRHDIDILRKLSNDRTEFQNQPGQRTHGMALVKRNRNLFILGKPGAGKTTFLKYITIQAAAKQLTRAPIFVSLNQWADSRWGKGDDAALMPFLVEQFDICNFPDAENYIEFLLQSGRALVLFDGLDEVKQEKNQRSRLTRLLQDFADKYDRSQHLITCRIAASEYAFAGFDDVEVANFAAEQVVEYVRNWFGENEKKSELFVSELEKSENEGLAELCNTPLLLSLLCLTFDNNMSFPPSRAELYQDALETLLRKWDTSRQIQRDEIYRDLSYTRKLHLLMRIAVPTFEKGELFFRQHDLEKWIVDYLVTLPGAPPADQIDGTAILKAIEAQHSVLVERAHNIYSFSHLTFQEYLTARYLVENQGGGATSKLVNRHIADPRWREVFLLTSSLLDDGNTFFAQMQRTIDTLILADPGLLDFITWTNSKANTSVWQNGGQSIALRLAYTCLALALDHDLARNNELARALERARDIGRVLAFDPTLDPDPALDLDTTFARTRALKLARTLSPSVGFDYGLYFAWAYGALFAQDGLPRGNQHVRISMEYYSGLTDIVVELAKQCGEAGLAKALAQLPELVVTASAAAWRQQADRLFELLRQRDLVQTWTFYGDQINKLNHYLAANELLVQCLKVAVVSDRQAVLDRVLAVPTPT